MTLRDALTNPNLSDSEKLYAAGWLQGFERRPEPFEIYSSPCASLLAEALGWTEEKARRIEAGLRAKSVELSTPEDFERRQLQRPLSSKQRKLWLKEIGEAQVWTCYYCALPGDGPNCGPDRWRWVLEHKTPLSRGGLTVRENMAFSCHACNVKKRNRTAEEHQARLQSCGNGSDT